MVSVENAEAKKPRAISLGPHFAEVDQNTEAGGTQLNDASTSVLIDSIEVY